jgi:hypothetical protein
MDERSQPARAVGNAAPRSAPGAPISVMGIAADVVRHALPLVPLYFFNGNIASYVLLTAFDLSLGLWLIVVTTRDRGDVNSVDPRSRWLIFRIAAVLVVAVLLAFLSAIMSIPIGMPAFLFGMFTGIDWSQEMLRRGFWIPIVGMSLLAAVRFQGTFESRTSAGARGQPTNKGPIIGDVAQDRRRSLADKAAQVTLIATFAALCYILITFGRSGLYALPILYAALLVFYDTRPDIAQRIFPKLWQEK